MLKSLRLIVVSIVGFASASAFAGVLTPLPITFLQVNRTGDQIQVVVTMQFDDCKYNYKGLLLDPIASGQGQTRYRVFAVGSERPASEACMTGPVERTETMNMTATSSDTYDFIKAK